MTQQLINGRDHLSDALALQEALDNLTGVVKTADGSEQRWDAVLDYLLIGHGIVGDHVCAISDFTEGTSNVRQFDDAWKRTGRDPVLAALREMVLGVPVESRRVQPDCRTPRPELYDKPGTGLFVIDHGGFELRGSELGARVKLFGYLREEPVHVADITGAYFATVYNGMNFGLDRQIRSLLTDKEALTEAKRIKEPVESYRLF